MFDPRVEPPISFTEATKLSWLRSRRSKRVNVKTLHRWASKGKKGIKLEVTKMGGARFTSEAAIIRFLEKAENADTPGPSHKEMNLRRVKEIAAANEYLAAEGF